MNGDSHGLKRIELYGPQCPCSFGGGMGIMWSVVISGSCTERHQCVSPCDEKKTVGGSTKGQRLTGSVRLDNAEGQKENVWARKNLGIAQRLKCVGCMVF